MISDAGRKGSPPENGASADGPTAPTPLFRPSVNKCADVPVDYKNRVTSLNLVGKSSATGRINREIAEACGNLKDD